MAARGAVQRLVEDDPTIINLGFKNVYGSNAVDTPAEDCFIVIRWQDAPASFKTFGSDRCTIWAHDKNRDYGRINDALQRLKNLLTGTVHLLGQDGWTLTLAEWLGEGPDLYDDGFGTITRYADFTVISRYTP